MLATEHSQSSGLDLLSLLSRGVDILSLHYAQAEELTVFKEVSTSLSGYSSLRIRQEVSLPSSKPYLPSRLSQVTFREKLGLPVSSPSTIYG